MAGKSRIEWTEATWNPVTGCTKVSQGCKNCYAERMAQLAPALPWPPNVWAGVNKKATSRLLNGRTWDEYPAVAGACGDVPSATRLPFERKDEHGVC